MPNLNPLSCLIIEDEPLAVEVMEDYIAQVPFLSLEGVCRDALFASERLRQEAIDVIFLDIHLPRLKGLAFLETLHQPPQTILTTAYHEYALDAFEAGVVDYLLKPIEFSRFLKAVQKLNRNPFQSDNNPESSPPGRPYRLFNVNKIMIKVYIDEILYIESLKDYSRIHRLGLPPLVTRGQIGEMEALFSEFHFLRIHRSYLIPLEKVTAFSMTELFIADLQLPIGRSYKELVSKALASFFSDGLPPGS